MSDFSHMCLDVNSSVSMRELINASSVTFELLGRLFCLFACIKLALQLETVVFLTGRNINAVYMVIKLKNEFGS